MFKRLILSCALFAFCSASFAQEVAWKEYDLKGKNPIGLNAKVKYPADFEQSISNDKDTVSIDFLKYFDNKDAAYVGLLGTKAEIGDDIDKVTEEDMQLFAKVFAESGGFKVSGMKYFKYKGLPALIFDAELSGNVSGDKRYSKDTRVIVLTKEHAINLSCGITGLEKAKKVTVDTHKRLKDTFCTQYFNSLELN